MRKAQRLRVLAIVASDATFERMQVGEDELWVGKCLHCGARLAVSLEGQPLGSASIEHIVPRTRGGTDDRENLALACARCNQEKGVRHDNRRRGNARALEVTRKLQERRRQRWRAPEGHGP